MPSRFSRFLPPPASQRRGPSHPAQGVTLVEVMVAMGLLATVMLGFLGTFVQSRRMTESSVMEAAATSLVYGLIEQMKGLDYVNLLPSPVADPATALDPQETTKAPPYIRLRVNQSKFTWLEVVYTPKPGLPQAPTSTPSPTATAVSLGAIDNVIGPLSLSTVTGTTSQKLELHVWLWIDEIPDVDNDVVDVKKITLVYTYSYNDGYRTRTMRDMEVFVRTRFDQ
ncbi:MAG: prepilin-type N-terminal cleavage/methylation domain-containing protein [Opitutaceae bacterium]|nr:prepilin-type N-terminal cleavage/methylation domain-containing protein [Opitutaceae bacterium]